MAGFLDLPLELRNQVYEYLLYEPFEPRFRGVMVVQEKYIKEHLPLRSYFGLLSVSRQVNYEFKEAIRHMNAAKQLIYELDITFSHGRPYFSLTWRNFPALSPVINTITINVDLRLREPFTEGIASVAVPHEHELVHLLDDGPGSFASQLFDYIAILLKTLAHLLSHGNPNFSLLYTEAITLNLRRPTQTVSSMSYNGPTRRVKIDKEEAVRLDETMRNTLKANAKAFKAYDAKECDKLFPLIQIGSLRFATEGMIWGEGHNLVLANDDFQWLRY